MIRWYSTSVNIIIVSGFVLAINIPMTIGQPSRFKRQSTTSAQGPFQSSWINDLISNPNSSFHQALANFGDGGNTSKVTNYTYKTEVRKIIKMPDGSIKEEITRNSNGGPESFTGESGSTSFSNSPFSNTDLSGFFNLDSSFDIHKSFSQFDKLRNNQPEALCPPLLSPNLNVRCEFQGQGVSCESPMRPGTIAIPVCNQHYKPAHHSEKSQLSCLQNGLWDSPLTYCIPVCGNSKEIGINTPLIVEGRPANIGNFPWHAGLYFQVEKNGQLFWDQQCGGSLISDQFVLTAAHCVVNRDAKDVRIAMGKFFRPWDQYEESEQKRNVSKITYPQDFHKPTLYFDIALLLLDRKIDLGEFVMPVCSTLLDGSNNIINKQLYIAGWGKTGNALGAGSSSTLLYNDVQYVPTSDCQKLIPISYSLFDKFCTRKNDQSEVSIAQQGDSGGGLTAVFDGLHYIFGIVSGKLNQVTTFTNITWPTHLTWMENEIKKYDSSFRRIEY